MNFSKDLTSKNSLSLSFDEIRAVRWYSLFSIFDLYANFVFAIFAVMLISFFRIISSSELA